MGAVGAEHVRELVRIAHDRGRPARDDDARELRRQQLGRLDVDVRVDQAGDEMAPGRVDPLVALVRADARDPPARHGDVAVEPLAREGGEHPRAGHDQVGLGVAARDGEQVRPRAHATSLASVPASTRTPFASAAGAVNSSG